MPRVSIVIPAYNQAQYLQAAIQSALSQTYGDFEVIVVDDGSTDCTAQVASHFGDRISYIRQDNQGLAGARNTGIRNAVGTFVALLDSDDQWLPGFLDRMIASAGNNHEAAIFYCQARCMDVDGHDLDQVLGGPVVTPEAMYQTVLRSNFIIPSTVLMRRSVVMEAGLFDQSLRSCEDWDFWLRLSPKQPFIGCSDCLVQYRIHEKSLSTDLTGMHLAAQAVVFKHFGDDDGQPQSWSPQKRRAYGGLYRYQALTDVLRQNNWAACAPHLAQALTVDPTLSQDRDLFFDLAMGSQPMGYRMTAARLDLPGNAASLIQMLSELFKALKPGEGDELRRATYGTAYLALGLVAYNTRQTSLCRKFLLRALFYRPELSRNTLVIGDLFKSLLGPALIEKARRPMGSVGS